MVYVVGEAVYVMSFIVHSILSNVWVSILIPFAVVISFAAIKKVWNWKILTILIFMGNGWTFGNVVAGNVYGECYKNGFSEKLARMVSFPVLALYFVIFTVFGYLLAYKLKLLRSRVIASICFIVIIICTAFMLQVR